MGRVQKFNLLTIIFAVFLPFIAYKLVMPWDPKISPDTKLFYFSEIQKEQKVGIDNLFFSPFFRKQSKETVEPSHIRPFFIISLRLWKVATDLFSKDINSELSYMIYMLATFVLCFLIILKFAKNYTNANFPLFLFVGFLLPWSLIFLYYPAYSHFSMIFFYLAMYYQLVKKNYLIVGLLSFVCLLSNSSMIVFIAAMGILTFIQSKRKLRDCAIWLIGFFMPFIVLELIGSLSFEETMDGPLTLQFKYFQRSIYHNHWGRVDVPKFKGMFFNIQYLNSRLLTLVFFLLIPFQKKEHLLSLLPLAFIPIVGCLIVDIRPGVQFGRSYFIIYPLFLMITYIMASNIYQKKYGLVYLFAGALFLTEGTMKTNDMYNAFHSFGHSLAKLMRQGKVIGIVKEDPHWNVYDELVASELRGSSGEFSHNLKYIPKDTISANLHDVDYLLYGPEIGTILPRGPDSGITHKSILTLLGESAVKSVEKLPFFGLFPLLTFEDEITTAWYMWNRSTFSYDSYKTGKASGMLLKLKN